jgi:uncharacterized Fe-S cluster-containing MiaB family protein
MFQNSSKFSKNDRKMDKYEILQGISYYTEEQVKNNKSDTSILFESLPKPIEKDKLEEALKLFEATPKE